MSQLDRIQGITRTWIRSEVYFLRLAVLWWPWNLRLRIHCLKSLPEDLFSGFLRPEKIHRPQPGLNPQTLDLEDDEIRRRNFLHLHSVSWRFRFDRWVRCAIIVLWMWKMSSWVQWFKEGWLSCDDFKNQYFNGENRPLKTLSMDMELWQTPLKFKFKRKILTWTGIWTSDLQISSLALPLELSQFNWRYSIALLSREKFTHVPSIEPG